MTTIVTTAYTLDTLKAHTQWVCFSSDKMPWNPRTHTAAKANDDTTWGTHEQAAKAQRSNPSKYAGIGYEFVKAQGITGVDLDKCRDEHGNFSPFAKEVVRRLNSYTEISPSGRGLHIWVRGNLPSNIGPNPKLDGDQRIEAYDCQRYFTVTNERLVGTPETIEERQEELNALYNEIMIRRQGEKKQQPQPQRVPETPRTSLGDSPYGLGALEKECQDLATMPEGGRNERLNKAAYSLGQLVAGGELSRSTVERELYAAADRAGLGAREIERTMKSGMEDGMKEPRRRPVDEIIYGNAGGGNGNSAPRPVQTDGDDSGPDLQFILDRLDEGEYGDSILFARLFRGKVLYDLTAEEWYKWKGHWWELDEEGSVKHLVSGKLASVYLQASASLNTLASQIEARAELSGSDEEKTVAQAQAKKHREQMKVLHGRAFALRQISRCKNVLNFAQSHEGMSISGKMWDRDTWLLAVPNGVLDLRNGCLRDGKPEDHIRTTCPTLWKGIDTPAPRWERFLHEVFADREDAQRAELISFLQRLFGYGITGEVIEHVFAVLFGEEGRNGKDTLQNALTNALGAVSGAISKDVLLEAGRRSAGAPTPHLSDLQGRRLAWANEPERGARFSVGQVKELSGGGEIPTRGLHEKKITKLQPTHLLILLTNHKPHADSSDSAFWTRLRLITFNMRFVDSPSAANERKKDTTLWTQLKSEAPGILAWLVRGCLDWQAQGLATPEHVIRDGDKYREEENPILAYIGERGVIAPHAIVGATELYDDYDKWADSGNLYKLNRTLFGKEMGKRFKKDRDAKGRIIYIGIGLLNTDGSEGFGKNSSEPFERAPQAASASQKADHSEGSEGLMSEIAKIYTHSSHFSEKHNKTIQTIQGQDTHNSVKQPGERAHSGLNSSSNPSETLQSGDENNGYEEFTI